EEELAGLAPALLAPAGELGGARAEDGDLDRVRIAALVRAGDVAERHEVVAEGAAGGGGGPGRGGDDEGALSSWGSPGAGDRRPLVERGRAPGEPEVRAELREAEEGDGEEGVAKRAHRGQAAARSRRRRKTIAPTASAPTRRPARR